MGDALQDEVPDGELRRYLHRAATATRTFRNRPIEDLAAQEDERDISGLIDHPAAWGIGRQKRELARACARANGSPIERPLQLHVPAIVDAVGRNSESGKAHVNRTHAKARCGNGRPAALRAGKSVSAHRQADARSAKLSFPAARARCPPWNLSQEKDGRHRRGNRPPTSEEFPKTPIIAPLTWQQKGRNIITRRVRRIRLGRDDASWRSPVPAPRRAPGAEEDDGASLVVLFALSPAAPTLDGETGVLLPAWRGVVGGIRAAPVGAGAMSRRPGDQLADEAVVAQVVGARAHSPTRTRRATLARQSCTITRHISCEAFDTCSG